MATDLLEQCLRRQRRRLLFARLEPRDERGRYGTAVERAGDAFLACGCELLQEVLTGESLDLRQRNPEPRELHQSRPFMTIDLDRWQPREHGGE